MRKVESTHIAQIENQNTLNTNSEEKKFTQSKKGLQIIG